MDSTTVVTVTSAMTDTMKTALGDAFKLIQSDVTDGIATALPYALAIGGIVIAIRICWGFFKSAAH